MKVFQFVFLSKENFPGCDHVRPESLIIKTWITKSMIINKCQVSILNSHKIDFKSISIMSNDFIITQW